MIKAPTAARRHHSVRVMSFSWHFQMLVSSTQHMLTAGILSTTAASNSSHICCSLGNSMTWTYTRASKSQVYCVEGPSRCCRTKQPPAARCVLLRFTLCCSGSLCAAQAHSVLLRLTLCCSQLLTQMRLLCPISLALVAFSRAAARGPLSGWIGTGSFWKLSSSVLSRAEGRPMPCSTQQQMQCKRS